MTFQLDGSVAEVDDVPVDNAVTVTVPDGVYDFDRFNNRSTLSIAIVVFSDAFEG